MLLVVPGGSNLQVQSEIEGIKHALIGLSPRVELEYMRGHVDPLRMTSKLREGWDILHFIGHGRALNESEMELRFNDADSEDLSNERWVIRGG